MNIEIKYNEDIDEFTGDLTLQMRVENYIYNHFPLGYAVSLIAPIYLIGGSIRDLINAKKPKDMDFVVMGKQNLDFILALFERFHIEYKINKMGGYKFNYKDTEIDLWLTDDLFSAIEYNIDGLFFNLNNNSLVSLTFDDYINNGLKKVNDDNNIENGRDKKLIKFDKEFRK